MSRVRRICWFLGVTLVIATGSYAVLAFPARADTPMDRAVQFWAAVHPEDPPQCSTSDLSFFTMSNQPPWAKKGDVVYGWVDDIAHHTCGIHVNYLLLVLTPEFQCLVLIHEVGHSWYALEHVADLSNVMAESLDLVLPPGVCYAPSKPSAPHEARRRRHPQGPCPRSSQAVRCLRPDPYGHPHRGDHTATGHRAQ